MCHNKVVHKLAAYGIAGSLLSWIKNFLTAQSQVTYIGYSYSAYNNNGPMQLPWMLYGLFVPRTIRTLDYSHYGWTIRTLDDSYDGLFVRWTIRTMDFSYHGLFVLWTVRTICKIFSH